MESKVPRIVIAGTGSGCGKTTVTCAVLQAFQNRRNRVGAFKCGPDYIDPMFHKTIIGAKSSNLDSFFFEENTLKLLLAKNGAGQEINIIEGVMGYYDGMGMSSLKASTCEIAQLTKSPVVLVVGAKGASLSLLAVICGFLSFYPEHQICGVILNQCTEMTYRMLAEEIRTYFKGRVEPLGFLPPLPECTLKSRHLGLVTAEEVEHLQEKMQLLAEQAEKSIALDRLLEIAGETEPISYQELCLPRQKEKVRIAIARDRAFCFYYEDSLDLLRELGAELVFFSPLSDPALPEGIHGLFLGGGYPELYLDALHDNKTMRHSIQLALKQGLPCIAECGGFMYLTESIGGVPMVGFLSGNSYDTKKLRRFGYVRLQAKQDTMLCRAGEEIPAHEFHHWDSEDTGSSFLAKKASGKEWDCVHATDTLYAGYPHFHFYANPEFAIHFYETCVKEKHRYERRD